MQNPQEARPRARSPFTAAFLSLLFPGLGHLYAGAPMRALVFAAPRHPAPRADAGIVLRLDTFELSARSSSSSARSSCSTSSRWSTGSSRSSTPSGSTEYLNAHAASGDGRLGRARLPRNPLSIAGLAAVVLVMAGSHVVVARYDLLAQEPRQLHLRRARRVDDRVRARRPRRSPGPDRADRVDESPEPTEPPTPEPTLVGTAVPSVEVPPWDGQERLNILLIGADEQRGGAQHRHAHHRLDRPGHQAGRDVQPAARHGRRAGAARPRPARLGPQLRQQDQHLLRPEPAPLGPVARQRPDARLQRPQGDPRRAVRPRRSGTSSRSTSTASRRSSTPRRRDHQRPGAGRRRPVPGHDRPAPSACTSRAASSTWTATQALRYARSRHTSTDFDRGARQQRVLLSLREQADPQTLDPAPARARRGAQVGRPDRHPGRPARRAARASPRRSTRRTSGRTSSRRRCTRSDTCQDARGCVVLPNIPRIKQAVKNAFSADPRDEALREALAAEGPASGSSTGRRPRNRGVAARRLPRVPRPERVGAARRAEGFGAGQDRHHRLQRRRDRRSRRRSPTSRSCSR